MNQDLLAPPSLLSVPGVMPVLLGSLFGAAADLFRTAPWKLFQSEIPIEVYCPRESLARIVVVLGAADQCLGLSVHDSPMDFERMKQAQNPLEAAEYLSWLALSYDPAAYLAQEDLDAIREHGWDIAGDFAYPSILRIGTPGPDLHAPALEDLIWLEGGLMGLTAFFQQFFGFENVDWSQEYDQTISVNTNTGQAVVRIRLPARGIELNPGG